MIQDTVKIEDLGTVSLFPDGDICFRANYTVEGLKAITLAVRLTSIQDVYVLGQIKQLYPNLRNLQIKYLLGARADKEVTNHSVYAFNLKLVAGLINSYGFEYVEILHPHSKVACDQIHNCYSTIPSKKLHTELTEKNKISRYETNEPGHEYANIVAPDKGSRFWIYEIFGDTSLLFILDKTRDMSNPHAPVNKIDFYKKGYLYDSNPPNFVVVDDLCDGGGTFVSVGNFLKLHYPLCRLWLVITHGIFSNQANLDTMLGMYSGIITTNSYTDRWVGYHPKLEVKNVW